MNLEYNKLLSNFAFNFNLRHYDEEMLRAELDDGMLRLDETLDELTAHAEVELNLLTTPATSCSTL